MTAATSGEVQRCAWAKSDPLLCRYHDEEWGVPVRESRELWELLMLEGFQAGLAWITVLRKREAFRRGFAGFAPEQVARFDEGAIERLMGDPGIIRSRAKIEATIRGAQVYLAMREAGEDFATTMWTMVGGQPLQGTGAVPASTPLSEQISKELRRRGFKFVGPVISYAWMQAAGMVNDHAPKCFRRAECARLAG